MRTASMKDIAEGRGMPGAILISFVGSSGVMAIPVDDGAIPCRTFKEGCVMHLDAPVDGLVAEMASGLEPIPWRNRQQPGRRVREQR